MASTRSSFASIAAGVSTRMHAAASSIASGTPSRARQMRATSSAFSTVRSNRASAACARSRKSRTAGASAISASDTRAGSSGRPSGSTSNTCSPCTRSRARLVTMTVASGSSVSSDVDLGAAAMTCSKLSSTMRSRRPRRAIASRSIVGTPPSSRTPSARATAGSTPPGSRTCSRATNVDPVEPVAGEPCGLDRESRLPDPARTDERDESPGVVAAQPLEQRRRGRSRGRAPRRAAPADAPPRRPRRGPGIGRRASAALAAAGVREASNRSASRIARSASMSSASSSAVEKGLYEVVSSSRIWATSPASRSSRSAGCFT